MPYTTRIKDYWDYGVILREGGRNNKTDCETHFYLIHIITNKIKEFHGTWYDDDFCKMVDDWVLQFPKNKNNISVEKLHYYYSVNMVSLLKEKGIERIN